VSVRRWLPALGVALVAALFTWFNRGERVAVDLGLFRFLRAPLTMVVFLAFLAGMLSMLLLSLRHDRRVREELRARGLLEPEPARPAAPAASAWGVAREPAAPRADDPRLHARGDADRTSGYPRLEDEDRGGGGERTVAYPRVEDDARSEDERTDGYPRLEDQERAGERTVAYPRLEDEERSAPDHTLSYPRRDEDPAA
jgi:uncharacterized integral membrane protein